MPLSAGTRLGPYEIIASLGVGGMGEVYRARDTKLKRDIAIKVLPEAVAADRERLARLEREAQVLAALNHPHIAHIHGFEDSTGTPALVMELVEGPTLAERIRRGPLPIDEALAIAKQIADALQAAHELGIVHRDLKPANIKVRDDGTVKVLDFGLARALEPGASGVSADAMQSPTITMPAMMTGIGVILGTAAYMSPEQAKGRPIDKRGDIFAFGCVVYEMLTGKRAFDGQDVSEIRARVIEREPDWSALPANTPPGIRQLLKRCLEKNLKERRRDAGDVRADIDDATTDTTSVVTEHKTNAAISRLGWTAAATMATALAVLGAIHFREKAPEPTREMRVDVTTPVTFAPDRFALSPDGRGIAFVASGDGPQRLWLRRFDQATAQALPGSEDAQDVSWSPNSRSIVFSTSREIKRLDISGGVPTVLADGFAGGTGPWNSDGVILVVKASEIYRIKSSSEGKPVKVLQMPGGWISSPQFLPDGKRFLFCVFSGAPQIRGTYIASLDESAPKRLGPAENGVEWLPPDRVVFVEQGNLWARRLDLKRLEWDGDPELITDSVGGRSSRRVGFSVSALGTIAYRKQSSISQLTWLDREGKPSVMPLNPDSNSLVAPEISPDGRRVAVDRTVQGNRDVWLIDLIRGGMTRFTDNAAADGYPVWFPDGNHIAFETNRRGDFDIYVKALNGTGQEQPIVEGPGQQWPEDVSSDGKFLLFVGEGGLWALQLPSDDHKPFKVATGRDGQFSSDGRWIAFETTESGRAEVVVQSFPEPFGRWPVSTGGGMWPRWSANGKELYFVVDGKLMASTIHASGSTFEAETPRILFPVQLETPLGGHPEYAVSRDGRFLVNQFTEATPSNPITVILNWKPKTP
jgi:serine/threonine protein kinase/Tol biopolymer transport system component